MLKFINREAEIWQLSNILNAPPNFVLFVYGPKSSGKSTLMMKISQALKGDVIYYDFRAKSPSELYEILTVPKLGIGARFREALKRKIRGSKIREGIELSKDKLKQMSQGKLDPFAPLINKIKRYKRPVLVLDEIQNLKYSGIDTKDLSQLMNFLTTLTKRMHLAHTIIVTSDCLFVDDIVKQAGLEGVSEFMYVGDLPKASVIKWLQEEGMNEEKANKVYDVVGGRPFDLWVVIQHFRSTGGIGVLENLIKRKVSRVKFLLKSGGAREFRLVKKLSRSAVPMDDVGPKLLRWAVDNEIAFFDPVNGEVYAISPLMRESLKRI